MEPLAAGAGKIEAEMRLPIGHVRVLSRHWDEPIDTIGAADGHRLELALLPLDESSRGCFIERWGPHRFERFGDVFLLPANQPVRAKSNCRQQRSVVCSFVPEMVRSWFARDLEWTNSRLRASLHIASHDIRGSLLRLGEEVRNPGFASSAMVEMIAGQIAIGLARYCLGIEEARIKGGLCTRKLRLIDERVSAEGAAPTLSELAVLCDLSVRQLTRAFRTSRGSTIGSYIAERRIDHAKRRLGSSDSVKCIAYSMGFTSPSTFSTAFRRVTGQSPREYRERARDSTIRTRLHRSLRKPLL